MKIKRAAVLLFILFFTGMANADSIWKTGKTGSPYSPEKSFKVGDILTVIVIETTTAQHKASTNTDIKDDFGAKFSHNINRLTALVPTDPQVSGGFNQKFDGLGATKRESNVETKVAAVVTEVMPNGNFRIEGRHRVVVNDENQEIIMTGVVRSKDVSVNNTIYSYQVADGDVSIKGTGSIQEAESPGWITRILNWIF